MSSLSRTLNNQFLSLSDQALAAGDLAASRRLAEEALVRSLVDKDKLFEAQALLLLARVDVFCSRMHRAREGSAIAARRFAEQADPLGESEAWVVNSYSCAALGFKEDALATAGRAQVIQESLNLNQGPSLALNYLGVAALWAKDYEHSEAVLEASASLSQEADVPGAVIQPLLNRSFNEMLRLHDLQLEHGGDEPSPVHLLNLLQQTMRAAKEARPHHADVLSATIACVLLHFVSARAMTMCHDVRATREHLAALREHAQWLPADSWLHALAPWAEAELFRLKEQIFGAQDAVQRMRVAALRGEHLPIVSLSETMAARFYRELDRAP